LKNKGADKLAWNDRRQRWRGGRRQPGDFRPTPVDYNKRDVDELLELIYMLKESGGKITVEELRCKQEEDADVEKLLGEMVLSNLVSVNDSVVAFSESGKKEAKKLIRAHRLAERLLTDVLLIQRDQEVEKQACAMEHILNPQVVDSICTILGHPRTCPHGLGIPPGPCCRDKKRTATPAVLSLDQLRSGESGKILYVETTNHARLDKLTTFGMLPGTVVRIHQRQPSLVVVIGETQLAIDREIAQNIYVVKTG
jgi:DtxR family Mn-dependent transcriptional regulator